MNARKLYFLAGQALLVGNILAVIQILLSYVLFDVSETQRITHPLFGTITAIWYISAYISLFGLIGFYLRQANRTGLLGLSAFAMLLVGHIIVGIGEVTNWSVALANYWTNPGGVYSLPNRPMLPFGLPFPLLLLLGSVLFGIAIIRAGVFPRIIGILFIASIPALFVGLAVPVLFNLAATFGTVPSIIAGFWLIKHPTEEQPVLVTDRPNIAEPAISLSR